MKIDELAFIANCIGSQKYAICTKVIPTEQTYQSCMATLLYHDDELLALQRCQLDVVELPLTEKALNLGFSRWLITSSKDHYTLIESAGNDSNPLARIEHPGCRVCIITLGCGKQLRGPNVHLRSDLTACDSTGNTVRFSITRSNKYTLQTTAPIGCTTKILIKI